MSVALHHSGFESRHGLQDSFVSRSYTTSLQNVDGSTLRPAHAWNNAPSPLKAEEGSI